ncbi:glycosyltransferase family 2 protein [Flavobacterium branchiicola]|uniref:Glycosyltransferase family 2 protein n=1 Tax=Flavobacterium branchiicola TaxID=1114875 RepID=A0ABV9PH92_9FLAO|nr:glycosyltransferase family 2 protein [Flavobacterium branchiicola]MBS7255478.1 glycosyltransferase family 2 protein [Flavobacterium branchiicola]
MVAIIIPFYKLSFFEEALKSLANQTDKRFKVYIGDDKSPENPIALLEKYSGKFDFVYHRFENNLGSISLTEQWERCIALSAKEEWIMVLGDDDVLGSNVISKFYENLIEIKNFGIQVVKFSTIVVDSSGKSISQLFIHPTIEHPIDSYLKKIMHQTRSSLSEYLFTRKTYEKYKFYNYPLGWHSDDRAWIEFSDKKPIYSINDSIIFIRVSNESITGNKDNLYIKNQASIEFLKFLWQKNTYKKKQNLQLMYRYEVEVKRYRKLLFNEWKHLLHLYILNFDFVIFIKFARRLIFGLLIK